MEDSGELKVVLHLKGGQARVGIQEPGADPVMTTVEAASLDEALAAVSGMVERARERWTESRLNPAYQGPPPPPPALPTPSPSAAHRGQPARPTPAREGMQRMF